MNRFLHCTMGVLASFMLMSNSAWSATQGNWPCVQRKVPEISGAAIWQGPPLDATVSNWRGDAATSGLVQLLAVRRTSDDEATKAIDEFAKASGAERGRQLTRVMAGLLELVNAERAEVIAGLERFGDAQKTMAELLRRENAGLATLRSAADADPAKIAQRLEQLTWNLRIFNERQKSLSSVCEVPVLIEKRLFAISKSIMKAVQDAD